MRMSIKTFRLVGALSLAWFISPFALAQSPDCDCVAGEATLGCVAGCLDCGDVGPPGVAGGLCCGPINNFSFVLAENFYPIDLALVQSPDKLNRFQEGCRDTFQLRGVPAVLSVNTLADVRNAINAAFAAAGNRPVRVAICGHGSSGEISVGAHMLTAANVPAELGALNGKIAHLILYGCAVAAGAGGQAFIDLVEQTIAAPVKAWNRSVYAIPNKPEFFQFRGTMAVHAQTKVGAEGLTFNAAESKVRFFLEEDGAAPLRTGLLPVRQGPPAIPPLFTQFGVHRVGNTFAMTGLSAGVVQGPAGPIPSLWIPWNTFIVQLPAPPGAPPRPATLGIDFRVVFDVDRGGLASQPVDLPFRYDLLVWLLRNGNFQFHGEVHFARLEDGMVHEVVRLRQTAPVATQKEIHLFGPGQRFPLPDFELYLIGIDPQVPANIRSREFHGPTVSRDTITGPWNYPSFDPIEPGGPSRQLVIDGTFRWSGFSGNLGAFSVAGGEQCLVGVNMTDAESPIELSPLGSCSIDGFGCAVMPEESCDEVGGIWGGEGSSCCPPPPTLCGDNVAEGDEECDGTDDAACPGMCLASSCICGPAPAPVCGNFLVESGEQCDGPNDVACPGRCRPDCTCPPSVLAVIPTVSTWGLAILTLVLLAGAKVVYARRRVSAAG